MESVQPESVLKTGRRIQREQQTVGAMIAMYCRAHHGEREGLCPTCAELDRYARARLNRCPFGEGKPSCDHCPIHCYRKEPRQQMREVMRWAGPRMMWRHPIMAIHHLIASRRPIPSRSR